MKNKCLLFKDTNKMSSKGRKITSYNREKKNFFFWENCLMYNICSEFHHIFQKSSLLDVAYFGRITKVDLNYKAEQQTIKFVNFDAIFQDDYAI